MKSLRVWLLCALLWLPVGTTQGQGTSFAQDLSRAAALIEALHLAEAEELLSRLDQEQPNVPAVAFQRAVLAFNLGQYAVAVELADRAIAGAKNEREKQRFTSLRTLMTQTDELTRDFVVTMSPDRRFSVSHPKGVDEILVPHALEVLRAMDAALTHVMGKAVPGPIRLEIYPTATVLSEVSPLTLEQIETSGTVALCKWNRLMITSPRALVRGYPWADTIAHELTHLYLSYVTEERAPVWLQEGSAKLLERRWRGSTEDFALDPVSRSLLEKASHDGKLLTFEQLHPSIAMLPSQEDAALAFAQVSTFMDAYIEAHGEAAFRQALAKVAEGDDARVALASAASTSFGVLERSWRAGLPKSVASSAPRKLARRFRKDERQPPDESADVMQAEARRFLRLGDMLWSRKRVRAAMLEYQKARDEDRDDPIVAARLARAALEAGDAQRSLAAVETLRLRYPEHAPTHAVAGAALVALGRAGEARAALIEAIRLNPFDPEPQCLLSRVAQDEAQARAAGDACRLLRSN